MTDFTFQKASKKQVKARIAIDGPSGSGKTYTALVAATALANNGKIAVIDTEHGSASLYSDHFSFDVLELASFSPETYTHAIHAAERAGYSVILIDSLSHAWEGEGGALDLADDAARRQKTPNSYTAWKEVTPIHRKMVDAILSSSAHIVATMRSKMDYVQEKDSNGRTLIRKIGLAPVQRAGMEYEFTLVGDMDLDHTIVISKSRCPALADAVQNRPDSAFFTKFRDWLNDGAPTQTPSQTQPTTIAPTPSAGNILSPSASPTPQESSTPPNLIFGPDATLQFAPEDSSALTLDEANAVTNSRGVPYGTIDSNLLKFMSGSLYKAMKEPLKTPAELAEYQRKLTAIETILNARAE